MTFFLSRPHSVRKAFLLLAIVCQLLMGPADSFSETPSADSEGQNTSPQWNVRVEVLMVALPDADALAILPELRNPGTIELGVTKLLDRIHRKEAILMGYPMLTTISGSRAIAESIIEERYPTEYEPASFPRTSLGLTGENAALAQAEKDEAAAIGFYPTAFETRNVGVTMEMEPSVSMDGKWIKLDIVPQRVALWHYNAFESAKMDDGKVTKVEQPQFLTSKVTTTIKVKNGERRLIGVHKLTEPAGHLEFFIVQATATKIE